MTKTNSEDQDEDEQRDQDEDEQRATRSVAVPATRRVGRRTFREVHSGESARTFV